MYEEALEAAKAFYAARGGSEIEEALERGSAEDGYLGAVRRAAETLEAQQATHREIAKTYAFAGNDERALDWLERGFEARDPNMPYIATGPTWDSLRDNPRFQDLLRRMNLPL